MAKKIKSYIKSQIPANQAAPAGLGSTLGPAGINIMEFCKAFNAQTQSLEAGMPIPVVIAVYEDRSFTFVTKKPPVTYYIKKASGISKGSSTTGRTTVGSITMEAIKKIAEDKMPDLNARTIESACEMIKGSAISMGLEVVEK
ncbi:MAG: 50S ribosomal protein L11 [Alphaproteobacteria bacterium]|nr:50S ribosomal protein L11 [Alphaproteobacteria bacterium]